MTLTELLDRVCALPDIAKKVDARQIAENKAQMWDMEDGWNGFTKLHVKQLARMVREQFWPEIWGSDVEYIREKAVKH